MESKERGHERWPAYGVRIRLLEERAIRANVDRDGDLGNTLCPKKSWPHRGHGSGTSRQSIEYLKWNVKRHDGVTRDNIKVNLGKKLNWINDT
jgi:hypothetical protein